LLNVTAAKSSNKSFVVMSRQPPFSLAGVLLPSGAQAGNNASEKKSLNYNIGRINKVGKECVHSVQKKHSLVS